jgi:hypothetical protein
LLIFLSSFLTGTEPEFNERDDVLKDINELVNLHDQLAKEKKEAEKDKKKDAEKMSEQIRHIAIRRIRDRGDAESLM